MILKHVKLAALLFELLLLYVTVVCSQSLYQDDAIKGGECWPENSMCLQSELNLLKCPLIWVDADSGDPVPDSSIPAATYGQDNFVARAEMGDGIYVIGRLEKDKVYTVYKDNAFVNMTYQVLTNPHGCILNWGKGPGLSNTIPSYEGAITRVARAVFRDILLVGQADATRLQVNQDNQVKSSMDFEVLQSYSKGLILELTSFKFKQDPMLGGNDILGIDQIINNADTEVRQTVYHHKRVFETTTLINTKTWGHTFKIDIRLDIGVDISGDTDTYKIPLAPFLREYTIQYPEEQKKSFNEENERIIEAYRDITVPPFSTVQVCSIVGILDGFNFDYIAQGRYFSPGLNTSEVQAILSKDNLHGESNGDSILVQVEGSFGGTLSTTSQFLAAPIDSPTGCTTLSKKIMQLKADKAFGRINSNEIDERNLEIQNMIRKSNKDW